MAFNFGPKNTAIGGTPAQLQPEGGVNSSGKDAAKARVHFNSNKKKGPKKSNVLLGLKAAAQSNNAPENANPNPSATGFPVNANG